MNISTFKSKNQLKKFIRKQLKDNLAIDDIIDESHYLYTLLNELIQCHYNHKELIGCGIQNFFISRCTINARNKKFNLRRIDDTWSDFSIYKCIDNKDYNNEPIHYIKRAFRNIINPQIIKFKNRHFELHGDHKGYCICEETKLKMKYSECHVDHIYPNTFDSLFYTFLTEFNLEIKDIPYVKYGIEMGDNHPRITNKGIETGWFVWHAEVAELRCIYWKANLQGKRTSRI